MSENALLLFSTRAGAEGMEEAEGREREKERKREKERDRDMGGKDVGEALMQQSRCESVVWE